MEIKFLGVPNNFGYDGGAGSNPMATPAAPAAATPAAPTPTAATPAAKPEGASPVDKYLNLFNNAPSPSGTPAPTPAPAPTPKPEPTILDSNKEIFGKAYETENFIGQVPKEDMELMAKGGPEGLAAMLKVINTAARQAAAVASETSIAVSRKAADVMGKETQNELKRAIVLNTTDSHIKKQNEVLLNPAFAPVVSIMQDIILSKNPGMDAETLAKSTVEYFSLMQNAANPDKKETKSTKIKPTVL